MKYWTRIEIACAVLAGVSGVIVGWDLAIRTYESIYWFYLPLFGLPSVVLAVATCFHAFKNGRGAMMIAFGTGSFYAAFLVFAGCGALYHLAQFQDNWGSIVLLVNFFAVISTLIVLVRRESSRRSAADSND